MLGINVVAEASGKEGQYAILPKRSCDLAQGDDGGYMRFLLKKTAQCAVVALVVLGAISLDAQAAEPDFDTLRPDIYFTGDGVERYIEGDTPCQIKADYNNNLPDRIYDILNAKFSDVGGAGCDYDLRRLSDGAIFSMHYQNLVYRVEVCSDGYTGPYWNGTANECRRNPNVAVAKAPICPNPKVGNPVEIASADKVLRVQDLPEVDGLGFSRTYHSSPRTYYEAKPAALGGGWTGDHSQVLRIIPASGGFAARIHLLASDGSPLQFMKSDTTGLWVVEQDGRCRTLTEISLPGMGMGYSLKMPDGSEEIFDANGRHQGTHHADGRRLVYQYDAGNRLIRVENEKGRFLSFQYNASKRLQSVADSAGTTAAYTYNNQGVLASVNYGSYSEAYFYQSIGSNNSYLVRVEDGQGNLITAYSYSESGAPTPLTTERAGGVNKYTLDFDTYSNWIIATLPSGAAKAYSFTRSMGRRIINRINTSCSTCGSMSTWYKYDANLNLIEELTGDSKWCRIYDLGRNLPTAVIEGADSSFNCATMAGGAFKRKVETDWDVSFRVPSARRTYDASSNLIATSAWIYNLRGQPTIASHTDAVTATVRTVTTSYCEATDIANGLCPLLGLVTSVDGPRTDAADTTTYTYYASDDASCASSPTTCPHRKGDLWKVTDALGRITETLAYDGAGRPLSVKDANGVVTDMTYHPRGWLTARKVRGTNNAVETDDQITQIEYWPTGLVKKVTQPDGAFTAYTYDAAHRLTDIADNAGNTIHYTLDNAGNRTAEATKDSGGNLKRTMSRVYSQLGQLQTAKDAYNHATGFTYDANGNNQTVTDALSRVTDNDYDPLNRLARTLQDVGGIEAETKFEYDVLDNLTKVTDPKGLDTTYQYNGFGDLTQLTSPDTGTTTYTYDSAGNRKTQTDARGIVSTYSYDALNRLTGIAYPTNSLNVGYAYDTANPVCIAGESFAIGRLTQMTDSSGDTQYCYDRFGNLTRKLQTTNAKVFTLRYAYTLAGQLQAITYPDGAIVDYVRDGQGRITEVGVTPAAGTRQILLNQATYHPFGPVASWVYGNGRTMSRPLNQNYQPTAVADNAIGGLSLGYEFDAVGNLSKLTNADQSVTKAQYGYDALNRLVDVKDGPTGTVLEHYDYDATGNRTSFTNAGGTTSYTYPGTNHRLTQVGATARTYDNAGNTTQIGGTAKEFVYNDAGRMSQVKAGGAATMNYQLNGRGEQVRKYLGASNTYMVYDEAGRWVGDYDNAGNASQQAIWLDDLSIGLLASNQLKYLQPDYLGTPRVVIDPPMDVAIWAWELTGEAFGNTVPNQDPDSNSTTFVLNMRFPGQSYDSSSGLNYNYFRSYEAGSGRYSQTDPIGLKDETSLYGYVAGNPLAYSDPLGLEKVVLVSPTEDPIIYAGASADADFRGECTVYAHGAWTHISDTRAGSSKKVRYYANDPKSMEKFNALLKQLGCQENQPVVLKSCNTGADPEGDAKKNVLQALAGIRQTSVTAPNRPIWYTTSGPNPVPYGHINNDIHAPMNPNDPGKYNTVQP